MLEWTAVLGAALVAFALQATSLHVAAAPYTGAATTHSARVTGATVA